MEKVKIIITLVLLCFASFSFSQVEHFRFKKYLNEQPDVSTAFAVAYEGQKTLRVLQTNGIVVKNITPNWVFVQTTARIIDDLARKKEIAQFYFEFNVAKPLSDTARIVQKVKEVHEGYGELLQPYTGKNVIVGFVDQGIDWTHPDFIDENGVPRVIAYWSQEAATDHTAPEPYGYGKSCDSISIVDGTCPLLENGTYHGSTVSGAATGNGRANGKEIGMATEAKIVAIQTDFSKANWTLTVADACDYLFRIADSLGLPAVMNLSVGDYFGSHDGDDPASELMEQLIDAKSGRIIVGAMGNSGDQGKYHLKGKIYNDTNFVWFKNNPQNQILPNSIYFDWWSDTAISNNLSIAFAANDPVTFEQTPYTNFYPLKYTANYVNDTLRDKNGNKLAIVEMYKTPFGKTYEIEVLIRHYDSLHYNYQLAVTGVGEFDLWSGTWVKLNEMVTDLPTIEEFPAIVNYLRPDSLSTIVSSWACSEKIITVGNIRNRLTHINNNGDTHTYSPLPPVGYIANASSRGPTRRGAMKPNVSSNGDMMMGAAPAYMRANPVHNKALELGGWHARNGGTSMASPVVAGIAALYLEKCPSSSYKDFIRDMQNNTDVFPHYGEMPNYSYGHGRINAYKLLVNNGAFSNDIGYCGADFNLGVVGLDSLRNYEWSTGETSPEITITEPGSYSVKFEYGENCYGTLSKVVEVGTPPIQPIITANQNILTSSEADKYQWYKDGMKLENETNQSIVITSGGFYQVKVSDSVGCSNYSEYHHSTLGITQLEESDFSVFPNPTKDELFITSTNKEASYTLYSLEGLVILRGNDLSQAISLRNYPRGMYILKVESDVLQKTFKIIKD